MYTTVLLLAAQAGCGLASIAGSGMGSTIQQPGQIGGVPQGIPYGIPNNYPAAASNSPSGTQPAATPGPTASGTTITAHPDGNCQQGLKPGAVTNISIGAQFPAYNTTHQPTFQGAESTQGGGGYDVWWSIADPPAGCRMIVMKPYTQQRGTPGLPGGKEMINVGRGGCYFGNVPPETDLLTSICCGAACNNASLNSTNLLAAPTPDKRGVDLSRFMAGNKQKTNPAVRAHSDNTKAKANVPSYARVGSPAAHAKRYWYPMPQGQNGSCNFSAGQPYSQAGQQVIVTSAQSCPTGPCTISISNQVSFSTTATSSKSQTLTNTAGYSLSIQAGVDFIADAQETDTFSYQFSDAIQHTTGMDVMRGNSTSITNTLTLKLGNTGAVSFTPVYKCWTGPLDCGTGQSDPIDVCQPDFSTNSNGTLLGEYDAVVYNG